jgi:hypothetical protein
VSDDLTPGTRHNHPAVAPHPDLFTWSGGDVVLLASREADRLVIARGWRQADRLEHIRRWSFATPPTFAGQIKRLVRDATADSSTASHVAHAALTWALSTPNP